FVIERFILGTALIDGVIVVGETAGGNGSTVDHRAEDESLDHERPIEELFEDQLTCADLIVLNKTDLIDDAGLSRVRDEV
ncbi:GTP-binding protein, partial [Rhizobium ruizarguesonis]